MGNIVPKNIISVDYTGVGSLNASVLPNDTLVKIYFDLSKESSLLTSLMAYEGDLYHTQRYVSSTEFATVEMKQVLTLYVKRTVIGLDPEYYTKDDPKLHGFISKLSYEGIKYVAEHVVEFADAFKHNKVSEVLNIPKPGKKYRS